MANKCPTCHSDNSDTARFCSNCATSLSAPRDHRPSLTETLESPARVIAPGTVFAGRYEILDNIGAGGMGEVYRALDKNLGRHVAIKILPAAFAEDKERMARFEREARLLAALNHPNIASIHGLEASEGRRFLVLELAEGETLQARLDRGALTVEEALETCRELAEGLEVAHEKGIVHRDLKPGNIMIAPEGKVKILDFGLAKAYKGETTGIDIANSPTITAQMTEPGIILGTAAYMSPEQARGRSVDKRADIWAFGCIFYECLTGKRAFQGETVSDTLAHILRGEPDWNTLPPSTPRRVKELLRRCLQKDPRERIHDIADARIEIGDSITQPGEAVGVSRPYPIRWIARGAALGLLLGIMIGFAWMRHLRPAASSPVLRSVIKVEPGHWLDGMRRAEEAQRPSRTAMVISGDGRFVVYSAIEENPGPQAKPQLYLRRMEQAEAKPIAGTEGGINPFLSPDNQWVGFWADGTLKKVPIAGGVPTALCDAGGINGASWGPNDTIVYAGGKQPGLSRISADGGKPESLTTPDPKREESSHRLPFWFPNGKAILFTVIRHGWDSQPWVALLRLDTREWRVLLQDAADAKYVPTGHLIFLRRGTLMGVRFDAVRMEIIGQPSPIIDNVMQAFGTISGYSTWAGQFNFSDSGSLVYAAGGVLPDLKNSLVWVDRRGVEQPVTPLQLPFFALRLSPDGQRIAYNTMGREWQVFVYDLNTGANSRLTTEGWANFPIWTPDGKRMVFTWMKSLIPNLYSQLYDGSSPRERLTTSENVQFPGSWSSDGQTLAFLEAFKDTGWDIVLLEGSSGRVRPFLNSQFSEIFPEFSPDGHWIAYTSDESQRGEVYVRPFPGPGMKLQVSNEGGGQPLWGRNGKELFYRCGDQVWAVDFRTEGSFSTGKPRLLFERPGYQMGGPIRTYDLSRDGQRFLMVKLEQRKPTPVNEMTLVQNWFEELKRLVPAGKK